MFRQNKHVFFFFPLPPQTIASHEHLSLQPLGFLSAVILQVLCHSIASGFLMPTGAFTRDVHTARSNGGSSRDNFPRNPRPTRCGMAWPVRTPRTPCTAPCVAFAWFAWFTWRLHSLHSVCTLCAVRTVLLAPPAQQFVTTGSPHLAGAGGRGRASRGRLH